MSLLGIDIGGTKMAMAILNDEGKILFSETVRWKEYDKLSVGDIIILRIKKILESQSFGDIISIGICVPGIYRMKSGTVWAPNIPGWDDYALLNEMKKVSGKIPVAIDSDRACYILGETWMGNTAGCKDAIYLAVGTGIGAGIITDGNVLRGSHDIAGAIGWMALQTPFQGKFISCGCFEENASGEGIAKTARIYLREDKSYSGELKNKSIESLSAHDVFAALKNNDDLALRVMEDMVQFWGMAAANLVSLFNPEKIIFGGGIFGPATPLIPKIKTEAAKWAQPISMMQVSFEASALDV
ncbi:MAG: ROK family protein, partial [Ginsengibacter sp.]